VDTDEKLDRLATLIEERGNVLLLTGAGLSTESGIPDYRSPRSLERKHKPMTYQQFVGSEAARQRYWARSHFGWRTIPDAKPNRGHLAVAELEARGYTVGLITQNVDGLHQRAGSTDVLELHGSLHRVLCLNCGNRFPRARFQRQINELNPGLKDVEPVINPDGDAEVPEEVVRGFAVPACPICGGVLKPDVIYFGENVPKERVEEGMRLVDESGLVLVLGSSLAVMSGLRFVLAARRQEKPVAAINDGLVRNQEELFVKVEARLGEALPALLDKLPGHGGAVRDEAGSNTSA